MRRRTRLAAVLAATMTMTMLATTAPATAGERWSAEKANAWYNGRPWPVGCNYIPSTAINQLEMWQADTFDLATIDRELGYAEGLGFNAVRVFLHDIPWTQDKEGFAKRIDQYLATADKHHIATLFVLLDSVWDPDPRAGKQRAPKPGVHNSGWVQSPGAAILKDPHRHGVVEDYVKGVIGRFKDDRRVLGWDLMNEPDNTNGSSYGRVEPAEKAALGFVLLRKAFAWAREVAPSQPITSGVWLGDWSKDEALKPIERFLLEQSDVISFHNYARPDELKTRISHLKRYGRPILCTEYMARPAGSTFDPCLGVLREARVGAFNWGFVAGKSQTIYPWDSWKTPYPAEPKVWFHDIFRADGSPYDAKEVAYIRKVTGKSGR
ncbi:MAG TPA: endo-1,4-beta-xylanase [Isosphaeraceae bacterium]|jgi:hypothetical protein|nr:endo-1,4-beta-xylanase [Isosphaeraceae bacterium]